MERKKRETARGEGERRESEGGGGARRVLHEVKGATMERTGMFINCEDGLQIPW